MAADHSARGSMKTGVKPERVCELQDTNDHRQVERKWRLPISVGELSALEGRFINHALYSMRAVDVRHLDSVHSRRVCLYIQLYIMASSQATSIHTGLRSDHAQRECPVHIYIRARALYRLSSECVLLFFFDLGGAGLRTELKHIIKCRKRNQMGFPQ